MNWVEGIGPAGIGKTTFFRKLVLKSYKSTAWVTEEQGLSHIIRNPKDSGIKKKLLAIYFRQNLINFRKQRYLNSQYLFGNEILNVQGKPYNTLLESYLDFLRKEDKKVVNRLASFLWYVKLIKTLCAFDSYKYKKTVFFDEGILQNHPNLENVDWEKCILPRGLIFFYLSPELNFSRIMDRKREGVTRVIHRGLNGHTLKAIIEDDHKRHFRRRKILRNLNIPTIDVDLSEPDEKVYQRVNDFLTSCSNPLNV